MGNPILTMLQSNSKMNDLMKLYSEIQKGDINTIFENYYRNNTQFRQFVDSNKGKTAEQIAKENGVDLSLIKNLIK